MQHDPAHTALPWAVVPFVLQVLPLQGLLRSNCQLLVYHRLHESIILPRIEVDEIAALFRDSPGCFVCSNCTSSIPKAYLLHEWRLRSVSEMPRARCHHLTLHSVVGNVILYFAALVTSRRCGRDFVVTISWIASILLLYVRGVPAMT